jgi:DNA-binding MarR family transcriptional regulator
MKPKPQPSEGRFAYEGLNRVIHERARLSLLTSLITNPKGLTFNDLKQLCSLTDGNLSRHLQVLEKDKIIEITKGQEHNRSLTVCRITAPGRKRYLEYLSTLEQVVRDAAKAEDETGRGFARSLSPSEA